MKGRAGVQHAFQTTSWTLLEGLHADSEAHRRESFDMLARIYWPPVFAYIRRFGKSEEEAADLTQAFFSDVVVTRRLFEGADQDLGRLRDLIRTALRRYLIDAHRTERRPVDARLVSLDAIEREERLLSRDTASNQEEAFDRRWALALMQEALRRTEAHFREIGKLSHWRVFEARVVRPATRPADSPPLAQLAAQYDYPSAADVSAALQVVKKRLAAILQQVVAETTSPDGAATSEYQHILTLLGKRAPLAGD